ncbi:hypothetical protein HPB52_020324 [Rhipicephalus sanguineus]|uniref:Uncharacterized protein n=1 Tax=Rhipicephalus sanguineus TaxID=34632 RepID=A0A9D4PHK9_RHISA|nr:hypothetical protein HPB52_020324 [Rhipicephalus sanguineus]
MLDVVLLRDFEDGVPKDFRVAFCHALPQDALCVLCENVSARLYRDPLGHGYCHSCREMCKREDMFDCATCGEKWHIAQRSADFPKEREMTSCELAQQLNDALSKICDLEEEIAELKQTAAKTKESHTSLQETMSVLNEETKAHLYTVEEMVKNMTEKLSLDVHNLQIQETVKQMNEKFSADVNELKEQKTWSLGAINHIYGELAKVYAITKTSLRSVTFAVADIMDHRACALLLDWFAEAAPEGDAVATRRKMSAEEIRAVSKRLFRRSTLLDAHSAAAASEMAAAEDSSSDEDPPPPRVVGVQVVPEGPIYELPPPPRKVPPPPPVRRDSLLAPPGESLLPPPSLELFTSDDEDNRSPAATPDFPLPPKKFPKHAGLTGTTTAAADEEAHPWRLSGAEITADASAATPSERRPTRPGVVHFAPVAPTVVLLPLSPEDVSSPRKKSATLGNFLDTHETSWRFTPGHRTVTASGASVGDQAMAPGASRKDSKEELMTSSSDTDDLEDLPPPPQPECGTEDSTDSSENIYEDIGPSRTPIEGQRSPIDGQRSPQISVATLSLVRPHKTKKFARSLQDALSAQLDASKAKTAPCIVDPSHGSRRPVEDDNL